MDVLQLFTIANVLSPDKTQITEAFEPIKTWNVERAARVERPGFVLPGNSDNEDVAGPDSIYDSYA